MPTRDEPVPQDVLTALPGAANEGAALIGSSQAHDPAVIVRAINAFVASPPKKSLFKRVDNWNERAMPLGALWGEQLVRRFGWEWVLVTWDDGGSAIGVVDSRRSVGIFPFDYVFGCLEEGVYPTIELSYNMLLEGSVPMFKDRTYTNVMDGIHHIVPPA